MDYGNEVHNEREILHEGRQLPKEDRIDPNIRPDGYTKDAVVETKPATASGVKKGLPQLERYERASQKPGILDLYKPKNGEINLPEIVQKNFKNDPIVQAVKNLSK